MAALTKDKQRRHKGHGFMQSLAVKASTLIYKGAIVATDATGYGVNGADTAGLKIYGVAEEQRDNSSGASGDLEVNTFIGFSHPFTASGATQAWVGQDVYIVDNDTVALSATTTNDIKAGRVVAVDSATQVWVYVGVAAL